MRIETDEGSKAFIFGFGFRYMDLHMVSEKYKIALDTRSKPTKEEIETEDFNMTLYNIGDGSMKVGVAIDKEFSAVGTEEGITITIGGEVKAIIKPRDLINMDTDFFIGLFDEQGDSSEIVCEVRIDEFQSDYQDAGKGETVVVKVTQQEGIEIIQSFVQDLDRIPIRVEGKDKVYVYGDDVNQGWKAVFYIGEEN